LEFRADRCDDAVRVLGWKEVEEEKVKMGILTVFQELHPISIVFTFALAILINAIIISDVLSLTEKLFLGTFIAALFLTIAAFETCEPQRGSNLK
jgi:hypothetical protein